MKRNCSHRTDHTTVASFGCSAECQSRESRRFPPAGFRLAERQGTLHGQRDSSPAITATLHRPPRRVGGTCVRSAVSQCRCNRDRPAVVPV